jgi:hypothetical protein
MQKFKDRWEIKDNWQLVFPVLGLLGLLFSSYLIGKYILELLPIDQTNNIYSSILSTIVLFLFVIFLFITLKLFNILETKWNISYRWELIAIFIVFAVTGSTAARISSPILSFLGLDIDTTTLWVYWLLKILLIFPVYQLLLIIVGWTFGQFNFFWEFEKKMLRRMGFSRLLKKF